VEPSDSKEEPGNAWHCWAGPAELRDEGDGLVVQVGEHVFGPTDARAAGAICFAYGLDNSLFHTRDTPPFSSRWLVWHFSALLSRWETPDIARFAEQGLHDARLLAGANAAEFEARFIARLNMVKEFHAWMSGIDFAALAAETNTQSIC